MPKPARRAVIYCRISRTTDESVSIARQERDLSALCALEGWDIVEVIRDDGKSGTRERQNANRALDMLRDGTADTLLVWKFDRWSRQGLRAVSDLIDVTRDKKGVLFFAKEDGLRSDAQAWRIVASVLAEVAAMEAENTSARILAARAEHLRKTRPEEQRFLGGRAPFGYRVVDNPHGPGKALAVDPYEAAIVRDGAERLIGGEMLSSLTRWLESEAVATPQSPARKARQGGLPVDGLDRGKWRVTTVRNLWRSETLLGRTTQRRPVLGPDGEPVLDASGATRFERHTVVDAAGLPITRWEPVLDYATFSRLLARLPGHGRVQPRRTASWLTNVARCAGCGGKLYAQKRERKGRTELQFRCVGRGDALTPCPAPSTVGVDRLEAYVEQAFLGFAGDLPELERVERIESPDVARQLQDVAQALADVTTALLRDGADTVTLLAQLEALKAQRRELQARPSANSVHYVPTGRTLADVWARLGDNLAARREHLGQVIDRVEVARSARTGDRAPLGPDRIRLVWNADRGVDLDEGNSRGPGDPAKRRAPRSVRLADASGTATA